MFKDVTLPVVIGAAKLNNDSHTPGWDIRLDLINPTDHCHELDSTLGDFAKMVYRDLEDTRFKQTQFAIDSSTCELIFAPNPDDMVNPKLCIVVQEVNFEKQVILLRKSIDEEMALVLQLRCSIAKTNDNTRLIKDFSGGQSYVRIIQKQAELFDDGDNSKTEEEE